MKRDKEYSDDKIKEMISSVELKKLMNVIQKEYSLEDILDEIPQGEILDSIPDDDKLDSLKDTWTLDEHDIEVRQESYNDIYEQVVEDLRVADHSIIRELQDGNSDSIRQFFCDLFEISYYDEDGLFNGFNNLLSTLEKSTYKDKSRSKWLLVKR